MISLLLMVTLASPDSAHVHYAQQDVAALQHLLAQAETRADSLLYRYRLYPLTEDVQYLADLPRHLDDGTAREYALLAGLWGFRAGEASFFNAIRYGRRSSDALDAAKAKAPNDPFVLLIEGQSYLFRPAIAGKDAERALRCFRKLQNILAQTESGSVPMMEAKVWTWYALRTLDRTDAADALRLRLLAADPPPLFRQFLMDPPQS